MGEQREVSGFDPALCYSAPPFTKSLSAAPEYLPSDYVLRREIGLGYTWRMLVDMDHEWATRAGLEFTWPSTYFLLCVKVGSQIASMLLRAG
jgi:hypothetical protein